ncbi:MAG: aromatic amino acid lyase, partial [Myxococcales bacterium]|nr:aromatic amino acid lyase [Myxococcales bacterium]
MSDARGKVIFGAKPLAIESIVALAEGRADAVFSDDPAFKAKIDRGAAHLRRYLEGGGTVYGVTTGFGDSCVVLVPQHLIDALPHNLVRFHGCGTGRIFDETEAAAVVAVRLAALCRGWSAVRWELLGRLRDLLNLRLLPRIPAEGSVGASGDLTPLSYLAALLIGERECTYGGVVRDAAEALAEAGLEPLRLEPKESLALMNGTSVMAALGCLAFARAKRLARLCAAITAMASDITRGNRAHFDDRIFAAKPHPGQRRCAGWIREDIEYDASAHDGPRLQDRYSIRCAPHV